MKWIAIAILIPIATACSVGGTSASADSTCGDINKGGKAFSIAYAKAILTDANSSGQPKWLVDGTAQLARDTCDGDSASYQPEQEVLQGMFSSSN